MGNDISGLVIAAPNSGSGKTVVTLGLLRALRNAGYDIAGAKGGPDFIDPAFHSSASGKPAFNLDPWAMTREQVLNIAHNNDCELLLVETMMGLFDGAVDGTGSGADLARILGAPILLVVDCASQSHSIAALVEGFANHREDVEICGLLLNKVGSERHEGMLREALAPLGIAVMGVIKRDDALSLPSRHLGLVQAGEIDQLETFFNKAAEQIERQCNLDAIADMFSPLARNTNRVHARQTPPGQRISIAKDAAFSFTYPHQLKSWRDAGAQLSFFSPLADEGPSQDSDFIYLPGGYPELHCGGISAAQNFHGAMRRAAEYGARIYGECGGYMVLGEALVDKQGVSHQMLGLLDVTTSFASRKLHLGYRKLEAKCGFWLGQNFRAHEFHYSTIVTERGEALFCAHDAQAVTLGDMGLRKDNVAGSYMHLISAGVA